jgi:hypothetical protein
MEPLPLCEAGRDGANLAESRSRVSRGDDEHIGPDPPQCARLVAGGPRPKPRPLRTSVWCLLSQRGPDARSTLGTAGHDHKTPVAHRLQKAHDVGHAEHPLPRIGRDVHPDTAGSEDLGASVAHFSREAAVARAVLWEARRGFNWTDPEMLDQIMEQLREMESHDTRLRAKLAKDRRLGEG